MPYFSAVLSAIVHLYTQCPHCKKIQHFKGKKKGDTVRCKKYGHEFVLK